MDDRLESKCVLSEELSEADWEAISGGGVFRGIGYVAGWILGQGMARQIENPDYGPKY